MVGRVQLSVGLVVRLRRGSGSLKSERGNVSHTVSPRSYRLRGATSNESILLSNQIPKGIWQRGQLPGYHLWNLNIFTISERPCRIFTQSLKVVNKNLWITKKIFSLSVLLKFVVLPSPRR